MSEHLRRTKIVATLGPATDPPDALARVLEAGVDVVRLNFSHGDAEEHGRRCRAVREAAARIGREVAVLGDLGGPKIRIERFAAGRVDLVAGQDFVLDARPDAPAGDHARVGVSYAGLPGDVVVGDTLLLDDGLVALEVTAVEPPRVHTRVLTDGQLSDRKGLNKLGGGLSIDALTAKDRADIELAARLGLDFVAVSFCRSAADMELTRELIRQAGGEAGVIAKIERAEAIANLAEIIDASDAVMVARGDLGVEIGDAELPGLQKKIIREAVQRRRAVITATQMLQSMVDAPVPTRAEVLDVANAVIDGTDAVMLSAETAVGRYPDRAVATMARVCRGAERQFEARPDFAAQDSALERTDQAIALAAMFLSSQVGVRAIVALTESGATARWLSRYRTQVPILALSRSQAARRRMALLRDVYPIDFDAPGGNPQLAAREAVRRLHELEYLAEGDRVLLTTGDHTGALGGTNTLKLLRVGVGGIAEGLGEL
ncbi:MAG: pyruvate kinase [Xanthomonadales bacterium]|nr:pyruvate kinase [Xanthomonadales bacterium]